ncbi:hypothetical protein [Bradyrhizobium sp. STM 3566]|uniref:hypothetical protein n=1 Tax=Bradyrhizobium sp. STM 3566 TaxID=578928 RepID=UPI0038905BE3
MNEYVCGLDLDRQHDRFVFAVLHDTCAPVEEWIIDDRAKACRQPSIPLKLDYVSQALLLRELMSKEPLASARARLVVDISGGGMGVADLMRSQGLRFTGVQITAGTEQTQVDAIITVSQSNCLSAKWKPCFTLGVARS